METRLRSIKHVALDLDGTIYSGGTLFPFTNTFLTQLRRQGIGYSFLTNNCSKSLSDYTQHLRGMGVSVEPEQIHTSAHATYAYLKAEHPQVKKLFLIGTPSLAAEVSAAGFVLTTESADDEPDAVLVAFDVHLSYASMCRAAYWIKQGKLFFATHPDRVCPTDLPTVLLDCGAVCAALTTATGRVPLAVLGKPNPRMLHGLARRLGLHLEEMVMIGDRLYTDMEMARRAGVLSVLVLSGEATQADVDAAVHQPDFVLRDLAAFGELLSE